MVKKLAGRRLTPICEYTDEGSTFSVHGRVIFRHECAANALHGGMDHDLHFVGDRRGKNRFVSGSVFAWSLV
jgi:hypothetical protein